MSCGKLVEKCVQVGEHQPPCWCILDAGHDGRCENNKVRPDLVPLRPRSKR